MKNRCGIWIIGILLIVGVAGGVAAPRVRHWWTAPPAGYCPFCHRHEHKESVVKIRAEGEEVREACCLACALTYGRQTSKAITVISVTDHNSGQAIDPNGATFVVGSDVSPCLHADRLVGAEGETSAVQWDRCLPSILAFATRQAAETFHAQHGGRLQSLREATGAAVVGGLGKG